MSTYKGRSVTILESSDDLVGPTVSSIASADTTAVAADIATLVADAGSPTQAHVTTLAADWVTYLAAVPTQPTQPASKYYTLRDNSTGEHLVAKSSEVT